MNKLATCVLSLLLALPLVAQMTQPQPSSNGSQSQTQSQPSTGPASGQHYTNSSGQKVHVPMAAPSAPSGATAKCSDGTYSFSQHASGTCSHHGGVSLWLKH